MKTFRIEFTDRLLGAIGILYPCAETVQAEDEKAAVLKLYDKYENVHLPRIVEVRDLRR